MATTARWRALLTWMPLALLTVITGLGAWLGATAAATSPATSGDSAQQVLDQIIASTRAAGSARVTYSSVSVGSTPLLTSTLRGTGVVNFSSGAFQTVSTERSTQLSSQNDQPQQERPDVSTNEQVLFRGRLFQRVSIPVGAGLEASELPWIKFPFQRETPPIVFGAFDQSEATQALQALSQPHQSLSVTTSVGRPIDGSATTFYRMTVVPPQCGSSPAKKHPPVRIDVWVDRSQRIVQAVSTSVSTLSRPPNLPKGFTMSAQAFGTVTTTSALRLYDYGTTVRIGPPQPLVPRDWASGSALSVFESTCSPKHHRA
jgi:hypothetical protein